MPPPGTPAPGPAPGSVPTYRLSRVGGGRVRLLDPITRLPLLGLWPGAFDVEISYSLGSVAGLYTEVPLGSFHSYTTQFWAMVPDSPAWFSGVTFAAAEAWSPGYWNPDLSQEWGAGPVRSEDGNDILLVSEWSEPEFEAAGGPLPWTGGVRVDMRGVPGTIGGTSYNRERQGRSVGIRVTARLNADGTWIKGLALSELLWEVSSSQGTDMKRPARTARGLANWTFAAERLTRTFSTAGRTPGSFYLFRDTGADMEAEGSVTPTAALTITWKGGG